MATRNDDSREREAFKKGEKSWVMCTYCVIHKNWAKYHTTGKKGISEAC